jgi:hypothetical protein
MRLVDSLTDQAVLEALLEDSKPRLPDTTRGLHYLLATPFRYRPRTGSRFRAPFDAGVWYGAGHLRTALAEKSYWRLRFLLDSPAMPDLGPVPHTAFTASVHAAAIDLRQGTLVRDRPLWTNPASYAATQHLASVTREAGVAVIRYESVRDPERAGCAALLTPTAFSRPKPRRQQTWFIAAAHERVRCARDDERWEFTRAQLQA